MAEILKKSVDKKETKNFFGEVWGLLTELGCNYCPVTLAGGSLGDLKDVTRFVELVLGLVRDTGNYDLFQLIYPVLKSSTVCVWDGKITEAVSKVDLGKFGDRSDKLLEIENFVFGKFYDEKFATEPFDNIRFGLVAKIFLPLMRKYSPVESKNFIIRHYKNFREILKTPFDAFFKEQLVLMTSIEEHLLANRQLSRTRINAFLIQLQEKTSIFLIYDIFYQTTTPEILKEICDSIYGHGSQGNELNKDLITFGFQ